MKPVSDDHCFVTWCIIKWPLLYKCIIKWLTVPCLVRPKEVFSNTSSYITSNSIICCTHFVILFPSFISHLKITALICTVFKIPTFRWSNLGVTGIVMSNCRQIAHISLFQFILLSFLHSFLFGEARAVDSALGWALICLNSLFILFFFNL